MQHSAKKYSLKRWVKEVKKAGACMKPEEIKDSAQARLNKYKGGKTHPFTALGIIKSKMLDQDAKDFLIWNGPPLDWRGVPKSWLLKPTSKGDIAIPSLEDRLYDIGFEETLKVAKAVGISKEEVVKLNEKIFGTNEALQAA